MFSAIYKTFLGSPQVTQATGQSDDTKHGEKRLEIPSAQSAIAASSVSTSNSLIPSPADREFQLLERSTIGGGVLSIAGAAIAKLAGKNSLAIGAGFFTLLSTFSYLRLQTLRQEGESQITELRSQIQKLQTENGLLKTRSLSINTSSNRVRSFFEVVANAVSNWSPSSKSTPSIEIDAGKQLEILREQLQQFETNVASFKDDSEQLEIKRAAMLKTIKEIPPDDSPLGASIIMDGDIAGGSAETRTKLNIDNDFEEVDHNDAASQPIDEWDIISKLNPTQPLSKEQLEKITILERQIQEFQQALLAVNTKAAEISADSAKISESLMDLLVQVSSFPTSS